MRWHYSVPPVPREILKMTESKEKEIIEEEEIIYPCSLLEKRKIEAVKVAS